MRGMQVAAKINFLELKGQYLKIKDEIGPALEQVCEASAFSGGYFVEKFEKSFADYCGTKHAAGVNSGTSALHAALMALGVKAGDEVVVPANTFVATAWACSYVGAIPVFADCDSDTWNLDVDSARKAITDKTKAIIGVHMYGQPFNIEALKALAEERGLSLVEDCAQAHGAKFKGVKVGSFGEMGCFSFYPGKNLGAYGEAGAVVTGKENYDKHIRSLRNHGSVERYHHDEIGYNMRMDGFQGAVLEIKLKYLDAWNHRRKEIARMYHNGITNPAIKMQSQPVWSDSVYHLFVVTTGNRDRLMSYLREKNIFCGLHYPVPCHLQKAYAHLQYREGDLPNAEYLSKHCISLPMFPQLTDEEAGRVIEAINSYKEGQAAWINS